MALIPKRMVPFLDQVWEPGVALTPAQEALLSPNKRQALINSGMLHDTAADPVALNERLDSLEADIRELRATVDQMRKGN